MSRACSVSSCFSNDSNKVDGRRIKFYSFPSDEKLKAQWKVICRSVCDHVNIKNKNLFRLCELHFEKRYFTENMQLKATAIPSIFDRPIKRQVGDISLSPNAITESRAKRRKLKNNDENISTAKNESFPTDTSHQVKAEPEKSSIAKTQAVNGSVLSKIRSSQGPFQYRLIIHIDKILSKPGPKSKKIQPSTGLENELNNSKNIKCSIREEIELKSSKINPDSVTGESRQKNSKVIQKSFNELPKKSTIESAHQIPKVSDQSESAQQKLKVSDQNKSTQKSPKALNQNKSVQQKLTVSDQRKSPQQKLTVPDQNKSAQQKLTVSDKNESTVKNSRVFDQNKSTEQKPRFSDKNESIQQNLRNSDQNKSVKASPPNIIKSRELSSNISSRSILRKPDPNCESSVQKSFQRLINSSGEIPRCQSGCQLEKIIWNTDPAFKCKKCNNVYIPQPIKESNKALDLNKQCATCNQSFGSSELLYSHVKEHLTCDVCHCVFKTQFEYKNHMGLHISGNNSKPFQCYLCDLEFKTKSSLQEHASIVHMLKPETKVSKEFPPIPLGAHSCKICHLIFKSEESLRNHTKSHKDIDNLKSAVEKFSSVKYPCTVCDKEFSTLTEINAHTKIHTETNVEERRCNICKIFFANDKILSEHLREHVARAQHCHICPKAFINKVSLEVHLKSHE